MNKTILAGLGGLLIAAGAARAQSTAFAYQGRLNSATNAATGLYDFSFNLYATSNGGPALTASNAIVAVPVTNGLFAVTLDFGNQFSGADRWLGIAVRTNGSGNFVPLAPRQPLTPTPYAIRAASAGTALTATTATTANTVAAGAVNGTALAGNAVDSSKIADGSIIASDLSSALLSNTFWRLRGNAGTAPDQHFLGTTDNIPLRIQAPQVGINTSVPRGTLEVKTGSGSLILRDDGGATPGLTIADSPNAGVLRFRNRFEIWPNDAGTAFGSLDVRGINNLVSVSLPGSGDGYFTAGNFGIATTAPQEKLHVAGKFLRVDGLGEEHAYLGGDGIGGEVQVGSLNPAINNVLLWNAANNTTMDLIADQITANQFNGPLNGSLSGTFSGGVSASSIKLGNSSTAGSVLTAADASGNTRWENSLRVERTGNPPLFTAPNVIAGYSGNAASNGVVGATVSGGGASGVLTGPNFAGGNYASVSGGLDSIAGGSYATVLGGNGNRAQGAYSAAAGRRAKANHQGSFVWADSQNSDFASTGNNQFLIRAQFGVGINTPSPLAGVSLDVNGDAQIRQTLVVDGNNVNAGSIYPGIGFGSNSGEGISSRRTSGENQYGLDFYTGSNRRFSIGLGGGMNLHDNPLHLRGSGDSNHGLGFRSTFATHPVDGPALFGYAGGALGTTEGGENWSLRWNKTEVRVKVLTIEGGADVAEPFPMEDESIEPGSVVVIDDEHSGRLKLSGGAYDTRVAGIVSGAGGVKPGIALHQQGVMEGDKNVALSGRVYVKADATQAAIRPGDLLTTSERPGHAMKVADHTRSQGAILGKAMSALKEGTGLVLVLVTLQ